MAYRERLLSKAVKHKGDEGEEDDTEVIVACIITTSLHIATRTAFAGLGVTGKSQRPYYRDKMPKPKILMRKREVYRPDVTESGWRFVLKKSVAVTKAMNIVTTNLQSAALSGMGKSAEQHVLSKLIAASGRYLLPSCMFTLWALLQAWDQCCRWCASHLKPYRNRLRDTKTFSRCTT